MKKALIILASVLALNVQAQTIISLEQAFESALQNNYQLKVLNNQTAIAENSANIGNAGLLPNVSLDGSAGANVTDTELEFVAPQPPVSVNNAQSSNFSAAANVNYVLFNGLSAQRNYQRLKLNVDAVDAQSRAQVEATLLQVAETYYALARAIEEEEIAESNAGISRQRYDRAALQQQLGTSLRTDLLSAEVALTSDSSTLIQATLQRENAERSLQQLMGTTFEGTLEVQELDVTVNDWTLEQLEIAAQQNNAAVKNAELQIELAKKDYQISRASLFPSLSMSGGYSYNNQQTEAGLILNNTQTGFNGALALSYPIFSGFRNRTERQNRMIALENSELELRNQQLLIKTELQNAWANYLQSIRLFDMETKSRASAELNLERMEEMFNAGQVTSTEFREAQLNLASALQRINNAEISVKLNELEIMRLTGQILSKK